MPTTISGLVLFVLFLTPGACYSLRRAATGPALPDPSPVKETAGLVAVSVATNAATLLLIALLHRWTSWPMDPVAVVTRTDDLARSQPSVLAGWCAGFLVLSCLLSVALHGCAQSAIFVGLKDRTWAAWLIGTPVSRGSAWWRAFNDPTVDWSRRSAYAGCVLTDGSWVGGYVETFSPDSEESHDRDLVLIAPLDYRAPNSDLASALDANRLIVSAREIRFISVAYVVPDLGEA